MRKSLLFFSCEPGGAKVLIPVIRLVCNQTDYNVIVLSYGLGAEQFEAEKIAYIEISPIQKKDSGILNLYQPDLVITSATSLPERDMSERFLWENARTVGIPALAFLDQWQNYAIRFSGPAENERLNYLPDYINCMNSIGEIEMIREGFDKCRLVKFGHPYLSSLKESMVSINEEMIRQSLSVSTSQRIILFVSEAIREHYGMRRGYDQFDALRLFMEIVSVSNEDVVPLIKLHPKDTLADYQRMLAKYKHLKPIIIKNELTSKECIRVSDVVYGMTSIMLIEAFVCGKMVFSLQPGLEGEDHLMLSRFGFIPVITQNKISTFFKGLRCEVSSKLEFEFAFKDALFLSFINSLLSIVS